MLVAVLVSDPRQVSPGKSDKFFCSEQRNKAFWTSNHHENFNFHVFIFCAIITILYGWHFQIIARKLSQKVGLFVQDRDSLCNNLRVLTPAMVTLGMQSVDEDKVREMVRARLYDPKLKELNYSQFYKLLSNEKTNFGY